MTRGRRGRRPDTALVLATVAELADDGFAAYRAVVARLSRYGERETRRGVNRTLKQGLLIDRRDAEGARFLALTSEGWRVRRELLVAEGPADGVTEVGGGDSPGDRGEDV